jgi:hypothetical protein
MKVVDSLAMHGALWAIQVITVGIFLLDLLTPVGVAASVFYGIPLLLTCFFLAYVISSTSPLQPQPSCGLICCSNRLVFRSRMMRSI